MFKFRTFQTLRKNLYWNKHASLITETFQREYTEKRKLVLISPLAPKSRSCPSQFSGIPVVLRHGSQPASDCPITFFDSFLFLTLVRSASPVQIRFILLQNRQGKTRLAKYYVPLEDSEKHKVEYEVSLLVEKKDLILVPDSGSGFGLGVADPLVVFRGSWLL
jgi:hypothetical protein